MRTEVGTRYVLYIYQPLLPYYFEQTDVIEVDLGENPKKIDYNKLLDLACEKNYCSPDEIKIIDVFDNREDLEQYLVQNDLRYLS